MTIIIKLIVNQIKQENYMDIADSAQQLTGDFIEESLKNRKQLVTPFSGVCLACEEPVQDRRYCDSHCREDHEKSLIRKMRS